MPEILLKRGSHRLQGHRGTFLHLHYTSLPYGHSCATIMRYLGYSIKDIQTWLGHSNYNFTADTYVHSMPSAHFEMANSYSDRLRAIMPPLSIGPGFVE